MRGVGEVGLRCKKSDCKLNPSAKLHSHSHKQLQHSHKLHSHQQQHSHSHKLHQHTSSKPKCTALQPGGRVEMTRFSAERSVRAGEEQGKLPGRNPVKCCCQFQSRAPLLPAGHH